MKTYFVFEKKGKDGFELKVTASNLSDHQLRLIASSIGDQKYREVKGFWPQTEQTALSWALAQLIRANGFIHLPEEVDEMATLLEQMLQEKWEKQFEKCDSQ